MLTSWKIAASCSVVFPEYWCDSNTGSEYGGELPIRIQCFCTFALGSLFCWSSSKHCKAVANPSAIFAWDSPFPPINLRLNDT